MKSRAKFGSYAGDFGFISGPQLAEAWERNFDRDLHQCLCSAFSTGSNHHSGCRYVAGVDHAAAVRAASRYLSLQDADSWIPGDITIDVVTRCQDLPHSQAELTLSLLTDPIELNHSLRFMNGRHRAAAILDVVPNISAVPYKRV